MKIFFVISLFYILYSCYLIRENKHKDKIIDIKQWHIKDMQHYISTSEKILTAQRDEIIDQSSLISKLKRDKLRLHSKNYYWKVKSWKMYNLFIEKKRLCNTLSRDYNKANSQIEELSKKPKITLIRRRSEMQTQK